MMTQLRSRSLGAAILAGVSCSATPTHAADLVLRWNEIGQHAVAPANAYIQSRSMAIMHLAILDAVTGADQHCRRRERSGHPTVLTGCSGN